MSDLFESIMLKKNYICLELSHQQRSVGRHVSSFGHTILNRANQSSLLILKAALRSPGNIFTLVNLLFWK
jgi:hypothetical protein